MRTTVIDTREAPNKWWAARDAQMRNSVNSTLYNDAEKARAERMKFALELVYGGKLYISYGRRGITVKVDRAWVRDPKNLALLEGDWAVQGIKKRVSEQGVVYNIPRA